MSKLTLIIGNKNYSSWSLRPWIFLRNAGIAFEEKRISLYAESTNAILAPYFSNYKVPVLIDDDFVVWDSLAILEYIAETYPHSGGWPQDRFARATARSISAEMHSSFMSLRSSLSMNCRKKFQNFHITPDVQKDIDRIKAIWRHCRKRFGQTGPWLFGGFCIADAMFAPVVLRFSGYGVVLDGVEKAYMKTMLGNPYLVQWISEAARESEIIEMFEFTQSP